MDQLRQSVESGSLLLDLEGRNLEDIFRQVADFAARKGLIPDSQQQRVKEALLQREKEISTAIGHAVAVPHTYLDELERQAIVFVRLKRPLNLGAPDGIPTRFLIVLLGTTGAAAAHLDTLTAIARLMSDDTFRYEAQIADSAQQLLAAIDASVMRTAVPTSMPVSEVPEGLQYSGRLFGGLMGDIRRRLPHYVSDFTDGLHPKCLAATLFLFFACLAPTVTFGGVLSVHTGGEIGAVEMIVGAALCGVTFALLAGQPLEILGGTGPMLVFIIVLYDLCVLFQLPFLPVYAWVGLWGSLLVVLLAITDASCLMQYFTRFTDEIFAGLISLIYIYEAVSALARIFEDLDQRSHHDVALLSLLLALGTFYIAMSLSRFRRSRYLLPRVREFLADFGPAIAIAIMTGIAVWMHEVSIDVLNAPDKFGTTSGRPWTVDLFAVPLWVRFAAVVPGLLLCVLFYLDQNITARLVNNRDHRLRKGEGYHLDLAVTGGLVGVCSLFGLPWHVAATVRSLNHIRALGTVEEVIGRDGTTRDRIIHVRENRLTGLAIHALIGCSLLLLGWLKLVPMAVLYGLFLFMGIVSMSGNQFFERLTLWLMDSSLYPVTHYLRRVPRWIVHSFTALQAVCLGILWLVKVSPLAILFPLFIALLVPVRFLASKFFSPEHLAVLDAAEEPEEEEMPWF